MIHMVETGFADHWRRLIFRDVLIAHPEVARDAYTRGKTTFIELVMARAAREAGARV